MNNLASIVCYACSLMGYWAGLFLEAEVSTMLAIVSKFVCQIEETLATHVGG